MTIAHVDPAGGAAGDMLVAALVDAGADLASIERALRTIVADGWHFECSRVTRRGIAATRVHVVVPGDDGREGPAHAHATLAHVLAILEASGLRPEQKRRAAQIFTALGRAEARVHGTTLDEVIFHEVGATDAILDVAAFVVAVDLLEIASLTCGPVPSGSGTIETLHGRYPNPPPATAELLRGRPTYDAGVCDELVTPTAAAILTTLCPQFGPRPPMTIETIGYGAGARDGLLANVTRISLGTPADADGDTQTVRVLEANVDDMSPQFFEVAIERTFAAGALDVWLTPIAMKKGRPAVVISAIVPPEAEAACAHALLRETTTIGVRVRTERRYTMQRETRTIATALGDVRVKDVRRNGTRRSTPEYDDVARIARETGLPVREVYRAVEAELERT